MLAKSDWSGWQLVFHIGSREVFLDIGDDEPVALFGGYQNAAAICEEGEVIFINRETAINSPESRIEASMLPGGEKASSDACCNESVFALSASGRVFTSAVESSSSALHFTEVAELSGKEVVCLSGTHAHCHAVSKEGRVFGRGSNSCGELCLRR